MTKERGDEGMGERGARYVVANHQRLLLRFRLGLTIIAQGCYAFVFDEENVFEYTEKQHS